MTRTDYNLPIFEDTDVADLNEYTEELAAALKYQIDRFGNPLTFKGIVATIEDLPEEAAAGDIYNVTTINKNYVFSGEEWLEYSDAIDNSCQDMVSDQYNPNQSYDVGDYGIKDNTLYRCTGATTGAWDLSKWSAVKVSDELKKLSCYNVTATGEDLNDYKTRGLYWFGSTNPANRPDNIAGWLEVIEYNNRYVRQIWHRSSSINGTAEFETYIRFTNNYGTNWSSWKKVAMGEVYEEPTQEIASDSNLNDYTTPGVYKCPNATVAGTLTNVPTTSVGFKLIVECTSASNRYRQTIYANRISGDLTYVRHYNGSWGNWYKYTMTAV